VLDAFSRRIVGWAMETHLRTELVLAALEMAIGGRCRKAGVRLSMGPSVTPTTTPCARASSPPWNASCWHAADSYRRPRPGWRSYIEGWYNPARRHSSIRYLLPIAYETQMLKKTQTT
jgi:putative transposase